ncbi:stress protein [Bacillus swezeyi]|uniref:Stress protein n=1 Tax=Bacillus swezeyi TaxID=1925020 RepID=A0A5M8RTK1_9BACI|nr:stress protein [Bacillus swezeyi]KAA6450426.1 stress protein [Bacillus swezeyi]TYS36965.1 stress protein [Bacillus swezeyi]
MKKWLVILLGALFLSACSNSSEGENEVTTKQVIQAFKEAGLEAENPSELGQKEFGNTREEGKRILVPALGDDAGGRLFKFKNKEDLEKAKAYYDELGNSSPLLFSHTYAKGNFLLQMNGEMKDAEFEKYKAVMDKVIK